MPVEILVISHKYPPSIGGMQYHCYRLVEQLSVNHKVRKLIYLSNYPKVLFLLTATIRALLLLLKHQRIKAIYVNDGLMALTVTPLLFFTKKPLIVTIHGLDISFPFGPYNWWIRKFLTRFHGVIAVSEPTRDLCVQKGIPPKKIHLVKNAVDLKLKEVEESDEFTSQLANRLNISLKGKKVLMSLGRGVPRKGHLWFTEHVMPKLPKDFLYLIICPDFRQGKVFVTLKKILPKSIFRRICLLIGAELDAYYLPEKIKALDLSDQVYFLPEFANDRPSIFQIMKRSHFFIMPNIKVKGDFEGFGLVALEASGTGLITLAGDVDGVPSAVHHGKNGYLIPAGDVQSWVSKITKLPKEDTDEISKTFQNYTLSMQFSWEQMTLEYVKIFDQLSKGQ